MAQFIIPKVDSIENLAQANFIRCAKNMLVASSSASSYDLFADILADNSMLNTGASSSYSLGSGKLTTAAVNTTGQESSAASNYYFGYSTSYAKLGQTFTPAHTGKIYTIDAGVFKYNAPADSVYIKIYDAVNGNLLGTSVAKSTGSISDSVSWVSFTFTAGVAVTANSTYFFTLERSGGLDTNSFYYLAAAGSSAYSGGSLYRYGDGSWTNIAGDDAYFRVYVTRDATVVWTAKTLIEAAEYGLVSIDKTLNSGTITCYLSDDSGSNWTEITALDTVQAVNFDAASLSVKAVITGNAELLGIAWGGY